jgi:hypothetical protein
MELKTKPSQTSPTVMVGDSNKSNNRTLALQGNHGTNKFAFFSYTFLKSEIERDKA